MFVENTQIYYLKNFLNSEELSIIDQRAASFSVPQTSDTQEKDASQDDRVHPLYPEDKRDAIFDSLTDRIRDLFKEVYSIPDDYVVHNVHNFHMMYPPFKMQEHWDGTTPGVHYGAILYITDPSEYEGGAIYYPHKNISIRPERGSIVMHPATEDYLHGVAQVTKGLRVGISVFVQEEKYMEG